MSEQEKTIEDYLEDDTYRQGVGIILYKGGKVFIAKRSDVKDAWQFPQGGTEEGEDLLDAARRELFEETALVKEQMELMAVCPLWMAYTLPKKMQKDGFKGQVQKWFLFEFKEDDAVIDLSKAQDKEFSDWRWEDKDVVIEQVADFRKSVYTEVLKIFASRIDKSAEPA
ncbi:MAG: putative (di)nucleoside polyphosphate hydrolase [Alphaproteobacteria bacterium]|jgi:putative (di)nucleoside polyphosphate hydrolase